MEEGRAAWPGIVADDSLSAKPTEHWYQARRLNSAVLAMASTLMSMRSVAALLLLRPSTTDALLGAKEIAVAGPASVALAHGGCALRNILTPVLEANSRCIRSRYHQTQTKLAFII